MRSGLWSLFSKDVLSSLTGQKGSAELVAREVEAAGESFVYQVSIPPNVQEQPLPLVVFLHGINTRGRGGYLPTTGPQGALVRGALARVPAIILLPHCRQSSYWSDPVMIEMTMRAMDATRAEFDTDERRTSLVGVSMGGYGVWSLAANNRGRFAALVSLCGGSPIREGERFDAIAREVGPVPSWLYHGAEDRVVPVTESRQLAEALERQGGEVHYTEYAGVGHDVWTRVIAERELMPWLISKSL